MDNSLPVLRTKHKLSDEELKFLVVYAKDPGADLMETELACGLVRGQGRELLRTARGRGAISALLRTRDERYADIQDQLVTMVMRLASWDPKDCFDDNGQLRHPRELPDEIRAAITEFKYYPSTNSIEYKFESRLHAITLLQKWFLTREAEKPEGEEGRAEWVVRGRQALPSDNK